MRIHLYYYYSKIFGCSVTSIERLEVPDENEMIGSLDLYEAVGSGCDFHK